MPVDTSWATSTVLSTSVGQSEPITWSTLLEKVQQLVPYPWLWILISLTVVALLFLLDIGDKLSGILGWLGIESPFQRSVPAESDLQKTRRKLLHILEREIDHRLETSLHERVKLDLYMEDQRQRVGKPKTEMVPEDRPEVPATETSLLNRLFRPFRRQIDRPVPLAATQKIVEIFDQPDIQGKLLILGEPGSGKTTELLHLAKDLVKRALKNDSLPIPLILELSAWDENKPFERWIADVVKQRHGIPVSITQQWLQQDDILLLLDGLDELGLMNQQKCIQAINGFLAERSRYGLVICCRREEYEAGPVKLDRLNGAVYLSPLRAEQIQTFFQQLNRPRLWESLRETPTLLELARSPLFLSMLVVAYQGKSVTSEVELFDAFIAQKFKDGNTGIYPPNKGPDAHQTYVYLVWLAQQLENARETEFLIEGLQPTLLHRDQKTFHFYKLVGKLIYGLIIGLSYGLIYGLSLGPIYGLIMGLSFGLIMGLSFELIGGPINEPIQLTEKFMFSFLTAVKMGLILGLIIGLVMWLNIGLSAGLVDGLIIGIIYGLIIGPSFGLIMGLSAGLIDEKNFPNQGIWRSLRNSIAAILIVGLISGLSFGLVLWLIFELNDELSDRLSIGLNIGLSFVLSSGLNIGLIFGLIFGLRFGLGGVIKHLALRIVLTRNGHIPWNYARFLDQAVELRFMQRVGGRYRFVHDLLRKHFAAMSLE